MSFPPPTGRPVAYSLAGDPWAEQARRHARHKAERRRRRRRRWVIVGAPVVCALGAVAVAFAALSFRSVVDDDNAAVTTDEAAERRASPVASDVDDEAAERRASPVASDVDDEVAERRASPVASDVDDEVVGNAGALIDEAWLLDRQDGRFDWGFVMSSPDDVALADMDVVVDFFDESGRTVHVETGTISVLASGGRAALGGTTTDLDDAAPVRLAVNVSVGAEGLESADALSATVSDVRIKGSGRLDEDDQLIGAVAVILDGRAARDGDEGVDGAGEAVAGSVVALWHDAEGSIVAAVSGDLEAVPGTELMAGEVTFALDLERSLVPSRLPDDLLWSRSVADR